MKKCETEFIKKIEIWFFSIFSENKIMGRHVRRTNLDGLWAMVKVFLQPSWQSFETALAWGQFPKEEAKLSCFFFFFWLCKCVGLSGWLQSVTPSADLTASFTRFHRSSLSGPVIDSCVNLRHSVARPQTCPSRLRCRGIQNARYNRRGWRCRFLSLFICLRCGGLSDGHRDLIRGFIFVKCFRKILVYSCLLIICLVSMPRQIST